MLTKEKLKITSQTFNKFNLLVSSLFASMLDFSVSQMFINMLRKQVNTPQIVYLLDADKSSKSNKFLFLGNKINYFKENLRISSLNKIRNEIDGRREYKQITDKQDAETRRYIFIDESFDRFGRKKLNKV